MEPQENDASSPTDGYFNMLSPPSNNSSGRSTPGGREGSPSRKRGERKRVGFNESVSFGNLEDAKGPLRGEGAQGVSPLSKSPNPSPRSSLKGGVPLSDPLGVNDQIASSSRTSPPGVPQDTLDLKVPPRVYQASKHVAPARPRPAIRRGDSITQASRDVSDQEDEPSDDYHKATRDSGMIAHHRAQTHANKVASHSASTSRRNSLVSLSGQKAKAPMANDGEDDEDEDSSEDDPPIEMRFKERHEPRELRELRESLSPLGRESRHHRETRSVTPYLHTQNLRSGQVTPTGERSQYEHWVSPPSKYREGSLAAWIRLGQFGHSMRSFSHLPSSRPHSTSSTPRATPHHSPSSSGVSTPTHESPPTGLSGFYGNFGKSQSSSSLMKLMGNKASLPIPMQRELGDNVPKQMRSKKQKKLGFPSFSRQSQSEFEFTIKNHIEGNTERQKYMTKLCHALMIYGAPTHRLEEYMIMSARVLKMEGQFLYIVGCMIISFDDKTTHTAEVKMVRADEDVDLGRLRDVHDVYKEVLHDELGAGDGTKRIAQIVARGPYWPTWFRLIIYGLASAAVGPFAFGARWIDTPIAFILGCVLGLLQLGAKPRSENYANVFVVTAAILTSFLARAFGSIKHGEGQRLFCFSALAQSALALILPGYMVLLGMLELQAKKMLAGGVRLVYAVLYTLLLGYGITIGTTLYGFADKNATSQTVCDRPVEDGWKFPCVLVFTICLGIINQAKPSQLPAMTFISMAGYTVSFFTTRHFPGNAQVPNTIAAFTIGILANLHARVGAPVNNWFLDIFEQRIEPRLKRLRSNLQTKLTRKKSSTEDLHQCETGQHGSAGVEGPKEGDAAQEPDTAADVAEKGEASTSDVQMKSTTKSRRRRVGHGLAAATMLPAIFVLVPSGIAAGGSLLAGIHSADQILSRNHSSSSMGETTPVAGGSHGSGQGSYNSIAFTVSLSVVQVAIGIAVGLFLSVLLVYPLGKKRSGLFSF